MTLNLSSFRIKSLKNSKLISGFIFLCFEYENSYIFVRPSGTEDVLRYYIESINENYLKVICCKDKYELF